MLGPRTTAVTLLLAVALVGASARADDVHVDAVTTFQAYEVRSPGTAAFLARRRLVQTLGLSFVRPLGDEEEGRGPAPRLEASVRLRLDQDFGDDCLVTRELCYRATEAGDPAFYQPLAETTEVDAPEVWVQLGGLPWRSRVRAGRHLHYDPIGLVRLDGASARAAPTFWLAAEAYGGLMVRRTSLAGSDAFVPQGDIRLDLDVHPDRAPFVAEPLHTWLAGGLLELGHSRWVRGQVGLREVRESAGLVARRGSLSLVSQPLDPLRLSALGVWDLLDGTLVDARAEVEVTPVDRVVARAAVEHHVPRFDWGTIWAYFDLVPISEARLGVTWEAAHRLELGAGLRGRVARFDDGDVEQDLGGEGHARLGLGPLDVGLSAFAWGGDLGPVAAVMLDAARPITRWLRAELRASVWHFDDPLREGLYGTSVAEALGGRLALSDITTLRLELEHAHSRVVGHRFRALAQLSVEVWR